MNKKLYANTYKMCLTFWSTGVCTFNIVDEQSALHGNKCSL